MKKLIKDLITKAAKRVLEDPEIQKTLYNIVNRPSDTSSSQPKSIWLEMWEEASRESAKYATEKMLSVPNFDGRYELLDASLDAAKLDGLYLEFGCGWEAKSVNYIAGKIKNRKMHGFDSFEGLPDDWFGNFGRGSFSSQGKLPMVVDNVQIHAGWFDETLPKFLSSNSAHIAFIHIDCDLYSSTKTTFDFLKDRIIEGTVIQLDEYFNYPGWREHEFKAFQEFIEETGLKYEYIGYNRDGFSVAVVIK